MAGYIKGRLGSPPELTLGQNCRGWSVLPEPGGYLDQDYKTMYGMNIALNIYGVVTRVKGFSGRSIHQLSDSERRMLKPLVERGLL